MTGRYSNQTECTKSKEIEIRVMVGPLLVEKLTNNIELLIYKPSEIICICSFQLFLPY